MTADGTPKLLDFGIAKILGPEATGEAAFSTLPIVRLLTPEYASPEQLRGSQSQRPATFTRWAVVLYELLTGHRPYRVPSRSPEEARAVAETAPEKPSAAVTRVEEFTPSSGQPLRVTSDSISETRVSGGPVVVHFGGPLGQEPFPLG